MSYCEGAIALCNLLAYEFSVEVVNRNLFIILYIRRFSFLFYLFYDENNRTNILNVSD